MASEDEDDGAFLSGFMFGNISKDGTLEDDVLDIESKQHLAGLSALGGHISIQEILDNSERLKDNEDEEIIEKFPTTSPTAMDFSDINEMIECDDEDDYDAPDTPASQLQSPLQSPTRLLPSDHAKSSHQKLVTPLADLLPPEFKGKDVREFFPDFRVGEVLRFSRLFPPQYTNQLYKKKRKMVGDEEVERTGHIKSSGMNWGVTPEPDQLAEDQTVSFSSFSEPEKESNINKSLKSKTKTNKEDETPQNCYWRFGPAQLWFDQQGVDINADSYDYGLSEIKNRRTLEAIETESETDPQVTFPDDAFLMMNQMQWEKTVVWTTDENKSEIQNSVKENESFAGWLVSNSNRTVESFSNSRKLNICLEPGDKFQSLFPIENRDLVYTAWEDKILWDVDKLEKVPSPEGLVLDLNDDNIVYQIPDDKSPKDEGETAQPTDKTAKKEPRRSTLALQKVGIVKEKEEEEDNSNNLAQVKDPFNISNDEYYSVKTASDTALRTNIGGNLIQHSTPAADLRQPFFPTFMGLTKLRQFHRPPLKRYSHGPMAESGAKPVLSLEKLIKRKAKARDSERQSMGGGEIFFMRTPQDLTGCDGEIILAEYSEEFPPIIMQPGMATKIKNHYKRRPGGDNKPPDLPYGELALAHHSPFLGNLNPGQTLQALENNMFRAPIYQHVMPYTDFLVIRNRQHYYIRKVKDIFCVGQLCPLLEVPGPNSKRANVFIRDFLQSFIFRLFWASTDQPRRIKMEDIKRAFQSHSESSIRKRLKQCADFKRTGTDSNWWVIKPDFRLPTHDEIRAMLSPEQCCAFYAMLAAEQRLKDAGYGEKSLFAPEQDEDDESKIEEEVKTAPWNTTRAYIQAVKGKCLLKLTGDTDPTGCGEGFAYVRIPNKPVFKNDQKDATPKKTVTGTNADLRRLNLADAKALLRSKGFPEAEIKKLSRWEVIDVVRTMSTKEAKAGEEGGTTKFARGNRFSVAEHQERYKDDCQRIFNLQNKILESTEVLSSCDDYTDSNSDDSDYDEMGKNIESMLSNKKSSTQLSHEREEAELKQLQKDLLEPKKGKLAQSSSSADLGEKPTAKTLKITRTFKDESGRLYTRDELVTKPLVIEAYLKIRKTKTDDFIKQFASLDDSQKEEMKKERRRIQEQLRRIKRNEEKMKMQGLDPGSSKYKKKKDSLKEIRLKCGACGLVGHMRTNKECPMYAGTLGTPIPPTQTKVSVNVAMTEEEEQSLMAERSVLTSDQNLVSVEGTKVKLSKELVEAAHKVKEKSLTLDFSKLKNLKKKDRDKLKRGRKKIGSVSHCDYLSRPQKTAHRRRADPLVSLCTIFEHIINDLKEMPNSAAFHRPVDPKTVVDYYTIITNPMDLQTLRENVRNRKYENREQFLTDVHLMLENSRRYNGDKSIYTMTAQLMLELTLKRYAEKEDKLMRLEKAINPLLDDNDQVAFSFILENIVENHIKPLENVWPFLAPVNRKLVKDYYDVIEQPMDLGTILVNVKQHKYHSREQFMNDVELMYSNSIRYNGQESPITGTAQKIVDICQSAIESSNAQLEEMEHGIAAKQEAAMEGLESESILTGTSLHDDISNIDLESSKGDYTIVESTDLSQTASRYESSILQMSEQPEDGEYDEDFVDIMDEDMTLKQEEVEADNSFSEYSAQKTDDTDPSQYEQYKPEPPQLDDEASFDATAFFQSNFNVTAAAGNQSGAEDSNQGGVMETSGGDLDQDLAISDSDSDESGNAGGFDFDDYD